MARSSSSTTEGAAADHTFGDQGEEAFHLIEPRTAGGGEVEIEVAVLSGFEPPLCGGALVRAVVVQNDVHVQVGRDLLLHLIEKLRELFAAMTRQATADDFAVQDIEGGK